MLEGWQWKVRTQEGGAITRIAPPTDLAFFINHTYIRGDGHEFELTWRDAAGKYHHATRRLNEQFRLEASRPQVFWKNEITPDLQVLMSIEHPNEDFGDNTDTAGGAFRVSYVLRGSKHYVQKMVASK